MKIATFNLRNLFDEGPRNDYEKEIYITKEFAESVADELAKVIQSFAPDILISQEIGSPTLFERIAKAQAGEYRTFVATPDKRGIANGTLFTVQAEADTLSDITSIPVMREGDVDTLGKTLVPYRSFVSVKTSYAGKPLYLIGIHIKTTSGMPLLSAEGAKRDVNNQHDAAEGIARALTYRTAQAMRLRELVDMHFAVDQSAQIIVLGDFNAQENSELLRMIQGDKRFPTTQLTNLSETIPKEKRFSFAGYKEKRQIDHILVSRSLIDNVQQVELLNDTLEDQTLFPDNVYLGSDHAPLVLTLK